MAKEKRSKLGMRCPFCMKGKLFGIVSKCRLTPAEKTGVRIGLKYKCDRCHTMADAYGLKVGVGLY